MVRLATICCPSRSRPVNRYSYLYKVRVTIFAVPFFELQGLVQVKQRCCATISFHFLVTITA